MIADGVTPGASFVRPVALCLREVDPDTNGTCIKHTKLFFDTVSYFASARSFS